jgi:hypothetical protein
MGFRMTVLNTGRAILWIGLAVLVPGLLAGCQPSQAVMSQRMLDHLALVDFTGLAPAAPIEGLDVSAALPRAWSLLPTQHGGLFTHAQWRSPSHATAVGVVHLRLPLPMSAQTLVWLAKTQYGGQAAAPDPKDADPGQRVAGGTGRLLREWSDAVGREWVEAENDRYHATGYVVTCGFDAWVVYSGYRRHAVLNPVDIQLAGRSMDSVVPLPLAAKVFSAKQP